MHALLLAGGFGTRLQGAIGKAPKGLISVEAEGKTLLGRMVDDLLKINDIQTIGLVTNNLHSKSFSDFFGLKYFAEGIKIINNGITTPEKRLGALGDLQFAANQLGWQQNDVLALSPDTYYRFSLQDFVNQTRKKNGFMTVVRKFADRAQISGRLGCAIVDEKTGMITEFVEKPDDPPSDLGAVPFYYYPQRVLEMLKAYAAEGNNMDAPGNIIPWLIIRQEPVFAFISPEITHDVGKPEDLELLKKL